MLYKFNSLSLGKPYLSGKHPGMRFDPFLRILPLWKPSSPISRSPLLAALSPVSRENLLLTDCIRKSQLQHTKNEQCYLALVASDIGTYLLVCSALLQNKVPFLQVWLTTFPVQKNKSNQCCANWWDANLQLHSLPFFAITPRDSQKELIIGQWEISRTKSEWCKNQINYCNSTATDLFLNMPFQKYHVFQNVQKIFCNIIKCKSSMQTHTVLLC